jgi:hypothetical protein
VQPRAGPRRRCMYMYKSLYMQGQRVQSVIYQELARYAMTWSLFTLLLTAVAIMASRVSVPARGAGPVQVLPVTLTRIVCAKCSETGQLSSRGLFLGRAAVHRHIAASKPCCAAKMGIWQIQVDVRTSDVMAGAGGAAGPAPDVRHQPEGTSSPEYHV